MSFGGFRQTSKKSMESGSTPVYGPKTGAIFEGMEVSL